MEENNDAISLAAVISKSASAKKGMMEKKTCITSFMALEKIKVKWRRRKLSYSELKLQL
jgi:hypothetical protein